MAQDRNQQAALETGARQLQPAPNVPDSRAKVYGQRAQSNYSTKLMGQLASFGAQASEKRMKDSADTMRTGAMIAVNQGQSLKEISESDKGAAMRVFGETATMQGATAQMSLIQMDAMANSLKEEVDQNGGDEMTPEQYREYSMARYAEALEQIPEGSSGRELLAQMGQKVLAQSATYQSEKHYAYTQKAELSAYSASVFSALQRAQQAKEDGEETIYNQAMADLSNRIQKPERMDEDAHAGVMTAIANDSLRFGDPTVMDMVLELNPMLSTEQRASIDANHEQYLQKEAEKGSLQQAMELAKINTMAASGAGNSAVAHQIQLYNAKYQRTPLSMSATENLFSMAAQAQRTNQLRAQAKADMKSVLHNGGDYVLGEKAGSKNLEEEMTAVAGTPQADQLWTLSAWHNKMLNSQLGAKIDPDNFLDASGAPRQTALDGYSEMKKWEGIKPGKAQEMVSEDTWAAYKAVDDLVQNGGIALGDAMAQVGDGWKTRPSESQYNAEAKDRFKGDELGYGRAGDYFGGMDADDFLGLQAQAEGAYKKYRSVGMNEEAAERNAMRDVQRNMVRVGDTVINSKGVDIQQTFGVQDLTTLQEKAMHVLRNDPQFAKDALGSSVGWEWRIKDTVITRTAQGPLVKFIAEKPDGTTKPLNINKDFAHAILFRYQEITKVETKPQFADTFQENSATSHRPLD